MGSKQLRLSECAYRLNYIFSRKFATLSQNSCYFSIYRTRKRYFLWDHCISLNKRLNYSPSFIENLHKIFIMMKRTNDKIFSFINPDFICTTLLCRDNTNSQSRRSIKLGGINFYTRSNPTIGIREPEYQICLPHASY